MSAFLARYSRFNAWANAELGSAILQLSPEQQQQEIVSSFNSIYKTVLHILGSENLWLERFHEPINREWITDSFGNDMVKMLEALRATDLHWQQFTGSLTDEMLKENLDYKNKKGIPHSYPRELILHHVFNHSTYHRGQLVTMLRQAGLQIIPGTDFILWVGTEAMTEDR